MNISQFAARHHLALGVASLPLSAGLGYVIAKNDDGVASPDGTWWFGGLAASVGVLAMVGGRTNGAMLGAGGAMTAVGVGFTVSAQRQMDRSR